MGHPGTRAAILSGLVCVAIACGGAPGTEDASPASSESARDADRAEAYSLIGTPLREPDFSPEVRSRLEKDLEIARAVMAVAPEREDSYIWLGRRLGYLARFPEAIAVFDEGLAKFPDSYKLLRFRGRHRARNRDFQGAIADYRRAAELVEDEVDSFEPDGILNERHQYLGTYKSNIHYYLGQTSFAVGDYETVLEGMSRSMEEPLGKPSPDRQVATAYWRYLAHRKLGQPELASAVVEAVPEELELLENHTYYDSVLFFKGSKSREDLIDGADNLIEFAFAMEFLFDGEAETAESLLREIVVSTPQGYWPAEAELLAMADDTESAEGEPRQE